MSAWMFFGIIIAMVVVLFIFCKRPMYEVMFLAFIMLCVLTGNLENIGKYWMSTCKSYLPYTLTGFIIFAVIIEKTGIINDLINIIAAVVGRFHGGAGYVALLATAAMGAFCGSGPGVSVATGTITIPAMKKTGYSSELAAVVSAAGACLGPVIPPSAAIVIIYEMLNVACPDTYTASQFWMFAWPISFWLVIQRIITLYITVRRMHVQPIPKEERQSVGEAVREGWKALLLPVVMFLPFLLIMLFQDTLITQRLGATAAGHFSSVALCLIPALAGFYVILVAKSKNKELSLSRLHEIISSAVTNVAPVIVITFSGYAINTLFNDLGVTDSMVATFTNMNLSKWTVILLGPLFFTIMGMFVETSTLYLLFGPIFIPLAMSVGVHPMIAAMAVNVMSNAMGQLTPPFALCLLVSVGIAKADFKKTSYLALPWVAAQFLVIVLFLLGVLPTFGLLV